jgi:hypothetical protein
LLEERDLHLLAPGRRLAPQEVQVEAALSAENGAAELAADLIMTLNFKVFFPGPAPRPHTNQSFHLGVKFPLSHTSVFPTTFSDPSA